MGYSTTTGDIGAFTWGDVIETSDAWQQFEQDYPVGTKFVAIRWLHEKENYGPSSTFMYLDDFSFTGPAYTYADWAADNGVTGAWDATDALGIHNVFRYAFGKPTGAFALLGIAFNNDGKAVIVTPPLVNGSDFAISVVVSDNVDGTGNSATYSLNPSGKTVINETGKTRRFFRLRAVAR